MNLIFNQRIVDKINEYKDKVRQFKLNMINIKQVRKAEKLLGKIYSRFNNNSPKLWFFC